jgi:hypothetical protein
MDSKRWNYEPFQQQQLLHSSTYEPPKAAYRLEKETQTEEQKLTEMALSRKKINISGKPAIVALNEYVQTMEGALRPVVFKPSMSSNLVAAHAHTLCVGDEEFGPMQGSSIKEVKRLLAVEYLSQNVPELDLSQLSDQTDNPILNSDGTLNYRHILHEICVLRSDIPQCAKYSVRHTSMLEGTNKKNRFGCDATVTIEGENICVTAEGDTRQVVRDAAAKIIVDKLYPGITAESATKILFALLEQKKPSKSTKRAAARKKRKAAEVSASETLLETSTGKNKIK